MLEKYTVEVCPCGIIYTDEGRPCIAGECELKHKTSDLRKLVIDVSMLYCWVCKESKASYLRVRKAYMSRPSGEGLLSRADQPTRPLGGTPRFLLDIRRVA